VAVDDGYVVLRGLVRRTLKLRGDPVKQAWTIPHSLDYVSFIRMFFARPSGK
jgi:hypothetical protein